MICIISMIVIGLFFGRLRWVVNSIRSVSISFQM